MPGTLDHGPERVLWREDAPREDNARDKHHEISGAGEFGVDRTPSNHVGTWFGVSRDDGYPS